VANFERALARGPDRAEDQGEVSRPATRIEKQTAERIAAALDQMVRDLPEGCAPQASLEALVRELAVREPWFMRLIMEDPDIREAYNAAIASIPIKLSPPGGPRRPVRRND
jgi:hypothetical protein